MRLIAFLAVAAVGFSSTPIQAETWCGAADADLGGGARLQLYMFDGSPEFRLFIDIPLSDVTLSGLKQQTKPWQLALAGTFDTMAIDPKIGISFDLLTTEGDVFSFRQTQIECGGIPHSYPTTWGRRISKAGFMSFSDLYRMRDAESAKCVQALRQGEALELVFTDDADPPRQALVHTRLPLERALASAREVWQGEVRDEKAGRCVMSPPLPPIPVLPPPPPPERRAP